MARQYRNARRRNWFRLPKKALLGLAALVLILGALEATNTTHFFHKDNKNLKVITKAGTATPKPKENVSANSATTEKSPGADTNSSSDGRAVDTHGQASTSTSSDQWVISKSGNLTVKQPIANGTLKSGGILSGSAKVSEVHYRLIDSLKGVVAQGILSVTDGNFSGTLQFSASATSGRLDVFSTEPDGSEVNEVQIAVVF